MILHDRLFISRRQSMDITRSHQTCPVCRGSGIVPAGFYDSTGGHTISNSIYEECRTCKGIGTVSSTSVTFRDIPGEENNDQ